MKPKELTQEEFEKLTPSERVTYLIRMAPYVPKTNDDFKKDNFVIKIKSKSD